MAYTNAAVIVERGLPGHRGPRRAVLRLRPRDPHLRPEVAGSTPGSEGDLRRRPGGASRTTSRSARPRARCSTSPTAAGVQSDPAARRDAAAPALRLPDPQAPLRPLHPRDGRRAPAASRPRTFLEVARALRRELRPRPHHGAGLQRRLDPAQRRRAVHPHRRDPAAAARQHGSSRRRHHGAARARQHPGLDRHPDAVQPAARLPADADAPASTTRSTDWIDAASATRVQGVLGQRPGLRRQPAQGLLGRRGDRRRTTSASTTCRGSPATTAPTARSWT